MNILNDIQEIFREFFDDANLLITEETIVEDIEDWDSLAKINLIALMEKHFGVKFNFDEISELNKIGNIVEIINSKIEKFKFADKDIGGC